MAVKPSPRFARRSRFIEAFSLVEVVMAIGVIAIALIILFALVPVGLKSNVDSAGESQAVNVLQALISDRQASSFTNASSLYNLPAISYVTNSSAGTLYLMEDGVTTNAQPAAARYRIDYTVYPSDSIFASATNYPVASLPMPVSIDFRVSWPAAATNRNSSVETVATFMTQ
jgi:uncharacterized protein (TIGR02598 family)